MQEKVKSTSKTQVEKMKNAAKDKVIRQLKENAKRSTFITMLLISMLVVCMAVIVNLLWV